MRSGKCQGFFYVGFTSDSVLDNPHKGTGQIDGPFTEIETNM